MIRGISVVSLLLGVLCGPQYELIPLDSGTTAAMRGLSVVDANVVWASGAGGLVLRSTDGGASWQVRSVPHADSLDFRDIEAFDSLSALVLSAGEDGRIYRTDDGGRSWQLQFRNTKRGAFFDCFDFWDRQRGIAMSDPVDGRFLIIRTDDGKNWHEVATAGLPAVLAGEAAFAASGSCLATLPPERVYLATGGGTQARVLVSNNGGITWQAVPTPVPAGSASAGIFSLAFRDADHGIAIGGDYQRATQAAIVARTDDGGISWTAAGRTGYVSGAAFVGKSDTVVAVGTPGTRISADGGRNWVSLDTIEYNAVQFAADGTGYAVGPRGRIARIVKR